MRFAIKDADGNIAAFVYAKDEKRAIGEYVANSNVPNYEVGKLEAEDVTDVPTFGEVGEHDREVGA